MWHVGKYTYQLDSKNRMRLPAISRDEYGDEFYITMDMRGSLLVRHKDEMAKLFEKLQNVAMADWETQDAIYTFSEMTIPVKQDEQGRFVLPQEFKDYAKIDKTAVIVGVPRGWSIWSEETFANRNNNGSEYTKFESIAEKLKPFGV